MSDTNDPGKAGYAVMRANPLSEYLIKGDLIVIAAVLLLGVGSALYAWSGVAKEGQPTEVLVRSLDRAAADPVLHIELPAEERHEVEGNDGYLLVEISGYRARVVEADCPDQICVHTGWLTQPGSRSICVPNQLVVEVMGERNGFDEIIR